jgi:ATP-dependent DNA helicase PIF1
VIDINARFKEAIGWMEETDRNLFLTGKAGTGKSTLLEHFCQTTRKQPVVLAPTGVAALNVKGQTIHRFFNFYIDTTPQKIRDKKVRPRDKRLYKELQTIIIDEVSMLRADLLDCIDVFLRMYGPDQTRAFGGVQMIFVGDLYQLPPVVSTQERDIFSTHYQTPYFFSAHALADFAMERVELETVYRQKDKEFVSLLNRIRDNTVDAEGLSQLNRRHVALPVPPVEEFYISLTTTNQKADEINDTHLQSLSGHMHHAAATISGDFGKEYYPTATDLQFKLGAQVMLLNNDPKKRWVNGSVGVIEAVQKDAEGQSCVAIRLQGNDKLVQVPAYSWEVYRFSLHENAIISEAVGTFTQYPFRLAWAITIHKSQGKTFERVVIDLGSGTFASGQAYVALSRCTSFEGMILKTPIQKHHIRMDARINEWLDDKSNK